MRKEELAWKTARRVVVHERIAQAGHEETPKLSVLRERLDEAHVDLRTIYFGAYMPPYMVPYDSDLIPMELVGGCLVLVLAAPRAIKRNPAPARSDEGAMKEGCVRVC